VELFLINVSQAVHRPRARVPWGARARIVREGDALC